MNNQNGDHATQQLKTANTTMITTITDRQQDPDRNHQHNHDPYNHEDDYYNDLLNYNNVHCKE